MLTLSKVTWGMLDILGVQNVSAYENVGDIRTNNIQKVTIIDKNIFHKLNLWINYGFRANH